VHGRRLYRVREVPSQAVAGLCVLRGGSAPRGLSAGRGSQRLGGGALPTDVCAERFLRNERRTRRKETRNPLPLMARETLLCNG
jgi:hypothetical protein